jgi:5,10-methylenetetrahydromethanopterin reductase
VYEAIARRAEEAGVDVLSVYHDLLYQPAIGPLLLMARVTERIRLGPAALNPFTLHPYEIAGQIAFLDEVACGRAYLGLVKGAWLDRLGLEEERPLQALREAVAIVRALLSGDESGVEGARFSLSPGTVLAYPRKRASVPLTIGTWGPATARWAGTVADEVKLGGSANPELVPVARGWIGNADVGIVLGCVSVVDEDGDWARERARAVVGPYLAVVAHLDPTLELRAGQSPPPDRFCIAGTPEEVAARVVELWDAGATRVELGTPQGRTPLSGVELVCERVLPLLGRRAPSSTDEIHAPRRSDAGDRMRKDA